MALTTLLALAGEVMAQGRRGATTRLPPPTTTASGSSSAATSAATPTNAQSGGAATTGGQPSAPRASSEPSQVLVSNVINRPGYHSTRVSGEIFASVGPGAWAWPFGGFLLSPGLRFIFPLTRNGPHGSLNNDFRLAIGGQVYFSTTPIPYWWVSAPVTFQWNFFLSNEWSVLLEAGVAVDVFTYDLINCYDHPRFYCDRVYFHPAFAFGLRRHFSDSGPPGQAGVSFRFTYPGGVQVALSF